MATVPRLQQYYEGATTPGPASLGLIGFAVRYRALLQVRAVARALPVQPQDAAPGQGLDWSRWLSPLQRSCSRTEPGLPGSLAGLPVALRSFPRPRPVRRASPSRRFRCCPHSQDDEGTSIEHFEAQCASLRYPLCTLRDVRRRTPRNTRSRLADCASTGRELNPLACDERFLGHPFLLSRAWPGAT